MKRAIVATLLASGLLLAAKHDKLPKSERLSGNQMVALETQSPRVHVPGMRHKKHATDTVVSDKSTINAFVQSRK